MKYKPVEIWSADWKIIATIKSKIVNGQKVDITQVYKFKAQVTKYIPLKFLLLDQRFVNKVNAKVKAKKRKIEINYIKKIGEVNGCKMEGIY